MSDRAVFLDRDGTLIEHYDYLNDPTQVQLLATAAPALRLLKDRGFLLVVVTNQSGIARGILTEKTLGAIHDRLKSLLAEQGVYLDQIYYCPYHPDGAIEKYRRDSDLRKPACGMLKLAAEKMDIDLSQSWMIGDENRDILAGEAAKCRTIKLAARQSSPLVQHGQVRSDFQAVNLLEAANIIVRYANQPDRAESEQPADAAIEPPTPQAATHTASVVTSTEIEPAAASRVSRAAEAQPAPAEAETQRTAVAQENRTDEPGSAEPKPSDNDVLLGQILRQLKSLNRQQRFSEFSVPKLLAGVVQMLVFLCLIMAFWFSTSPEGKTDLARNCLLLALVLQTLTLTLLMMHRS